MHAIGDPGHASVPHRQNAVVRLAEAVAKLGTTHLPVHICETTAASNRAMAARQPFGPRLVMPQLLHPALTDFVLDRLLPDRQTAFQLAAALHNTVAPTGLAAGQKINVIPGRATALIDGRLIPGQKPEDLLREVRAVVGDGFEFEVIRSFEGREESVKDPLFRLICETLLAHDPEGTPVPYLLPGFSDAQYFGRLGAKCYGFAPVRFPKEDGIVFSKLFHGHDERIHIEGFKWGLRCFTDLVGRFVTVPMSST
jgi:acetylornithine deacetylase/succinyl-diaminopimelate desuccinylase-like protein